MTHDIFFIDQKHFQKTLPIAYAGGWKVSGRNETQGYLWDDSFADEHSKEQSWSSEIEEIHEEPTKNGWIDVYERRQVQKIMGGVLEKRENLLVVEFGASVGYMIEELRNMYPNERYVATDIMADGLRKSCARNPDIYHIQCDFTSAPFVDGSLDFVYALNVLEHIADDKGTIEECYRVLKKGGHCLFVVPRGADLYDYFDEMLFHKRRYAKGELVQKAQSAGFTVVKDLHLVWLCYPLFWLKKKINQAVGRKLTQEEKIERVKGDIKNAMASPLAIMMIRMEEKVGKFVKPSYGIRELLLVKKE